MLESLSVWNYALIEYVRLTFHPKLNVLTGETGAGKSILVDSVMLLMGARAQSADVRVGAESARIEGVFSVEENHAVWKLFEEAAIGAEDNTIILLREIKANGKNTCRINGQTVTLAQFRAIARALVNIYGQHDYQTLSDSSGHRALLDSLGDQRYQAQLDSVAKTYKKAQHLGKTLKALLASMKAQANREKELVENLDVVTSYQLKKGEMEALNEKHTTMSNVAALQDALNIAHDALYNSDESAYNAVYHALHTLQYMPVKNATYKDFIERVESIYIQISELSRDLADALHNLDYEPHQLEAVEERLGDLVMLERRYNETIDDLIDKATLWQEELLQMHGATQEINDLEQAYKEAKKVYAKEAENMHQARVELGMRFREKLLSVLKDLSMPHADLQVKVEEGKGNRYGRDTVEFLLAPNPGMGLRPLAEIASGGEMSRIMLAFKSILTNQADIDTLIFDEIDTGIGGVVLGQVAKKLKELSEFQQILCVTHAPVIAAAADGHLFIEKEVVGTSTVTHVTSLTSEEAVLAEIARMLGGHDPWHEESAKALRKSMTDL